jgi:hypothetical protein
MLKRDITGKTSNDVILAQAWGGGPWGHWRGWMNVLGSRFRGNDGDAGAGRESITPTHRFPTETLRYRVLARVDRTPVWGYTRAGLLACAERWG